MENLVIESTIAFFGQDYSEAMMIKKLKINIAQSDVDNIRKAMVILNENSAMSSIHVNMNGFVEYLGDDDKSIDDWETGVEGFIVYPDVFVYYSQNESHSGDQFESEFINANDVGIRFE